jgi:hypothetical protein
MIAAVETGFVAAAVYAFMAVWSACLLFACSEEDRRQLAELRRVTLMLLILRACGLDERHLSQLAPEVLVACFAHLCARWWARDFWHALCQLAVAYAV